MFLTHSPEDRLAGRKNKTHQRGEITERSADAPAQLSNSRLRGVCFPAEHDLWVQLRLSARLDVEETSIFAMRDGNRWRKMNSGRHLFKKKKKNIVVFFLPFVMLQITLGEPDCLPQCYYFSLHSGEMLSTQVCRAHLSLVSVWREKAEAAAETI